jgi:ABC-type Mn2+/Zn2+ transport system permease subunit
MLRGGIDPLVAFAPLWLPLAFVWVLVLAMPLGLVRAYITDHFVDSTQSLAQQAAQIDRRQQLFLVVVGVVFLGLSVWLQSALPLLVALGTLLGAAMQYYRRRAYRAAIATIVLGLLIARLAPYLPHILDLRPGLLGLLIASLGVMLLLKSATQSVRVLLQRRRMRKLLPTISATKESAKLPLRQQ